MAGKLSSCYIHQAPSNPFSFHLFIILAWFTSSKETWHRLLYRNRLNASWDGLFPSFRATRRLVLLMIWYLLTFHWKSLLSNTVRLQCGKVWPTQAHLLAGVSSALVYNGICCCCHVSHLLLLFRKCSFWPTTALIGRIAITAIPVSWPHSPREAYGAEYKVRGKGKKSK